MTAARSDSRCGHRPRPRRMGGRSAALRPARHTWEAAGARALHPRLQSPRPTRAHADGSARVRVSGTHRPARRTTHDTSHTPRACTHPTDPTMSPGFDRQPARARTVKCPVTQHTHTSASPPTYAIPLLWARSRTLTELHSSTRALRRFLWRRVRSRRARNLPPNSDPCGNVQTPKVHSEQIQLAAAAGAVRNRGLVATLARARSLRVPSPRCPLSHSSHSCAELLPPSL